MDIRNHVGARKVEHIIVALQLHLRRLKATAAEVCLIEAKLLYHGAHRSVEDENAAFNPIRN